MPRGVEPIGSLQNRIQEQGRIRIGEKSGNRPSSLDTFRFTSPDEDAITQIAERYGGEARPWSEKTANVKDQFEVITKAKKIRVWVAPGGVTQFYELWSGGGCLRRCDGITCEIPVHGEDSVDYQSVPCICDINEDMECKPKTRMTVILPEIRFAGGWRIETSSWNAAREMPGMERLVSSMQALGLVEGTLEIADGMTKAGGRTKRFKYPKLSIEASMEELASGTGSIGPALPAGSERTAPAELVQGRPSAVASPGGERGPGEVAPNPDPDLDIIEAQVVEDSAMVDVNKTWPTVKEAMEKTGLGRDAFVKDGKVWVVK